MAMLMGNPAMQVKGLSPEEALRGDLVLALPHRIQSIPDGGGGAADQYGGGNVLPGIKFDSSGFVVFLKLVFVFHPWY